MNATATHCTAVVVPDPDGEAFTREIILGGMDEAETYLFATCGGGSRLFAETPVVAYLLPVCRVTLRDASGREIESDYAPSLAEAARAEVTDHGVALSPAGVRRDIERIALAGCGIRARRWIDLYPDLGADPVVTNLFSIGDQYER